MSVRYVRICLYICVYTLIHIQTGACGENKSDFCVGVSSFVCVCVCVCVLCLCESVCEGAPLLPLIVKCMRGILLF